MAKATLPEREIKKHLEPKEKLLWASAPNVDHILDLFTGMRAAVALTFLSPIFFLIIYAVHDDQYGFWSGVGKAALIVGAVGLYCFLSAKNTSAKRRTFYGVTNKRAIKLVSGKRPKITSFFSDDINTLGIVEQHSGFSDLHLRYIGGEAPYWEGFSAIQDADHVRALIEQHVLTDNKRYEINYFKNLKEDIRGRLKKWF